MEKIRFSKFLVTIKTDVPLDIKPEQLRRVEPDVDELVKIFNELEFKTLVSRLAPSAAAAPVPAQAAQPQQMSLFDDAPEDQAASSPAEAAAALECVVLNTPADIADSLTK